VSEVKNVFITPIVAERPSEPSIPTINMGEQFLAPSISQIKSQLRYSIDAGSCNQKQFDFKIPFYNQKIKLKKKNVPGTLHKNKRYAPKLESLRNVKKMPMKHDHTHSQEFILENAKEMLSKIDESENTFNPMDEFKQLNHQQKQKVKKLKALKLRTKVQL
jgi:hypothetical protein